MARENALEVTLSDEELVRLDELRPSGTPARFLRPLLHEGGDQLAAGEEALEIRVRRQMPRPCRHER